MILTGQVRVLRLSAHLPLRRRLTARGSLHAEAADGELPQGTSGVLVRRRWTLTAAWTVAVVRRVYAPTMSFSLRVMSVRRRCEGMQ